MNPQVRTGIQLHKDGTSLWPRESDGLLPTKVCSASVRTDAQGILARFRRHRVGERGSLPPLHPAEPFSVFRFAVACLSEGRPS